MAASPRKEKSDKMDIELEDMLTAEVEMK